MRRMFVADCMRLEPVWIEPQASALEALDRMLERGVRHLPVLEDERVVGILSIDDLRAGLPFPLTLPPDDAERRRVQDYRVAALMTYVPATVHLETPLDEAAARLADLRIGCLPVVDDENRLVGLLTETDALRALSALLRRLSHPPRRPSELEQLTDELRRERDRLAKRLAGYERTERELSADPHEQPTDRAEQGTDLAEVELTGALGELAAARLRDIDHALDRASRGALAVCDRCGSPIQVARLRALPGATTCVRCARSGAEP